ncbi:MAG: chitobiase/beta-hexosaminidase C-terminal domain-containing protein [Parasporobacterium sp.]|nr:chitobiase/beta-hexosaminidase C-terminal domain-containing protein [Parasporobacterium sp.]
MRCRECGLEVDNDKAFCPVCGAPMKVTADYEYIQAEIANKVDRFFNEEHQNEEESGEIPEPAGVSEAGSRESMAKTRNFYGTDSIFDGEDDFPEDPDPDDRQEKRRPAKSASKDSSGSRHSAGKRNPRPAGRILYLEKDQTAARVITALIIFVILAAAAVGVLAILGVFRGTSSPEGSGQIRNAEVLSCNLEAGATYSAPVTVTINNPQEGNVFYTLDGTEPNFNSKIYSGSFDITAQDVMNTYPTVHFRATSFSLDSEKSGEINMEFSLEYNEADAAMIAEAQTTTEPETTTAIVLSAPQISPVSGEYSSDQNILVSSPEGAAIYYTYDGSIPNERSTLYMGPVKMRPGTSTFSAVCIKDGVSSPVTSYGYSLEYNYNYSSNDALNQVKNELLWDGYVVDYDLYTEDGYAQLTHEGVYEIDGYTYYVIRVDFFTSNGALDKTLYRGVGVNYGNVYGIEVDNRSDYYISW